MTSLQTKNSEMEIAFKDVHAYCYRAFGKIFCAHVFLSNVVF